VPATGAILPVSDGTFGWRVRYGTEGVYEGEGEGEGAGVDGGAIADIQCVSDLPVGSVASIVLHPSRRWVERELASRAIVRFDLYFDRNSWPAAQASYVDLPGVAPGLDYPVPSDA